MVYVQVEVRGGVLLSHLSCLKGQDLANPRGLVILSWTSQAFCNSNLLAGYIITCLTYKSENTSKNQKVTIQVL